MDKSELTSSTKPNRKSTVRKYMKNNISVKYEEVATGLKRIRRPIHPPALDLLWFISARFIHASVFGS